MPSAAGTSAAIEQAMADAIRAASGSVGSGLMVFIRHLL
jgi:hypothetical protein